MEINSAFSSGVSGLNKASEQLTEASQNIAEQSIRPESNKNNSSEEKLDPITTTSSYSTEPITTEVINMKLAEVQAKSAANVMTTADDMVGLLIDVSV